MSWLDEMEAADPAYPGDVSYPAASTRAGRGLYQLHAGLDDGHLNAARDLIAAWYARQANHTRANLGAQDDGTPIDRLLIAYPPGVPLAVPGERWAPTLRQRVAASRRSGAEVYQLPPGPSHHPREHVS